MRIRFERELIERVLTRQGGAGDVEVDLVRPLADEQGGDGVAGEVRQCTALGHELVDADDDARQPQPTSVLGVNMRTISLLRIFPLGPLGSSSRNSMIRGIL